MSFEKRLIQTMLIYSMGEKPENLIFDLSYYKLLIEHTIKNNKPIDIIMNNIDYINKIKSMYLEKYKLADNVFKSHCNNNISNMYLFPLIIMRLIFIEIFVNNQNIKIVMNDYFNIAKYFNIKLSTMKQINSIIQQIYTVKVYIIVLLIFCLNKFINKDLG